WGQTAENMEKNHKTPIGCQYYSHFKLHLGDKLNHDELSKLPETINVISDYLKMMHKFILKEIRTMTKSQTSNSQIRYCLTVPAAWSLQARTCMRLSAKSAEIISDEGEDDRLMLIS